jgi:rhodanese-related sulfurtransferase
MIRDRLLRAVRAVGRRLLNPEERASVRERQQWGESTSEVDASVLPPLQDGDGDTPGPNHKSDIGRTWAAAQLVSGAGIVTVDVRSPSEWIVGHLPGALLLPAEAALANLDLVPGKGTDTFIAVYDATGNQQSGEIARVLREAGWPRARRLVGGFAEWVEEGEEVVHPKTSAGSWQIGDTVRVTGGPTGTVWRLPDSKHSTYGIVHASGHADAPPDRMAR